MTHNRNARGFGLIELLVTLAVLTLIISIGVPSFEGMTRKNQATARLEDLATALRLARQVAIEHNFQSRVCPRATAALDAGSCGGTGDWSKGFLVQVMDTGGGWQTIQNKSYPDDGTTVTVTRMSTSTLLAKVGFEATGNLDSASGPNVAVNVTRGGCSAQLTINITGRVKSLPLTGC